MRHSEVILRPCIRLPGAVEIWHYRCLMCLRMKNWLQPVTYKEMTVTNVTSIFTDDPCAKTLGKISEGMHVMTVRKGETIFSQGDCADSVYFVQSGSVKMSVVSYAGKEGVLAIIGPHGFFGEESLTEQSLRTHTATAMEPSTVLHVEKRSMVPLFTLSPILPKCLWRFY